MSFGIGIGDCLAVIQLANKIRKQFVDAPSQFKDISNEYGHLFQDPSEADNVCTPVRVRGLSIVLQDVDILAEHDLQRHQVEELNEITKGCHDVLQLLEVALSKYSALSNTSDGFEKKAKRVWGRLKWEPEDIRDLRARIVSNISLLNAYQTRLAGQASMAIRAGVDRLLQGQLVEERQAILDYITLIDYEPQQYDLINRRQGNTGQWLVDSVEFQLWILSNSQTLYCHGMPGAGKTILTSVVVKELTTRFEGDPSVAIAYLYLNFRRQDEQKVDDLLASLLKQLANSQPAIPESVKFLYGKYRNKRSRPPIDELRQTLQAVVAGYSKVFIVVDALDECQETNGIRAKFLSELLNLQKKAIVNLFITSRPISEIMGKLQRCKTIEIRASEDDVIQYLDSRMSQLPSFVSRKPDLQADIKVKISKAVDGMFLLAQLHFESLVGKKTVKAVKQALEGLTSGTQAYDYAYTDAMERIKGQVGDQESLATQVISWITCATRPLSPLELQHALAVEACESELDEDNLPEVEDMVSVCAGLVTVDEKSDIIRLVHYTAQDYFQRQRKAWFPSIEKDVANTCITYLSFDAFESGNKSGEEELVILGDYPLYAYAAQNWGHHARAASLTEDESKCMLDFLRDTAKVSKSTQMMFTGGKHPGHHEQAPRGILGIHIAAYFGLRDLVVGLSKDGYSLDVKDVYGRTPISWAAQHGHGEVVEYLLHHGAELESESKSGWTPLIWASSHGHNTVVRLLTEQGAHLEHRDSNGRTALIWASQNGHADTVRLLLQKNAELESESSSGRTPLSWAATHGHYEVVKELLDHDAKVERRDSYHGRTPLSWAAGNGHEEVVRLLVSRGADLESRCNSSWASRYRSEAFLKLLEKSMVIEPDSEFDGQVALFRDLQLGQNPFKKLLEDGAELESNSENIWALQYGHEAVREFVAEKGYSGGNRPKRNRLAGDRNQYNGHAPLSWVAQYGSEEIIKMMRRRKPYFEEIYYDDQTPLSWAATNGHDSVVKLLLEQGADFEAGDTKGRTPISWAAAHGHDGALRLLLARGAEFDSKDEKGCTPLWLASMAGNLEAVALLLANGAVIDSVGAGQDAMDKITPLANASIKGHEAVVELLVNQGARMESQSEWERTALSWAAQYGRLGVVSVLLENGAHLEEANDWSGQSPLSRAAATGQIEVAELLIAKGANLESRSRNDRTPLSWAAASGHEEMVKLLVNHGAQLCLSPQTTDGSQTSDYEIFKPLSCAVFHSQLAIVRLMLYTYQVHPDDGCAQGRKPLFLAAKHGDSVIVELLLERGADIDARSGAGMMTPLSAAAVHSHYETVKMLLADDRVDPDSRDRTGLTPLSWCVRMLDGSDLETVKLLLSIECVDPDSRDDDGRSPLSWAVQAQSPGNLEVVKLLLATGRVDPDSRDNQGRSPLSHASQACGNMKVTELLLAMDNVNPDSRDHQGRSPLSYAAEYWPGQDTFNLLLATDNVDPDSRDYNGRTPLSWVTESARGLSAVEKLLETGRVDPNSWDNDGITPISRAVDYLEGPAIVKLLLERGAILPQEVEEPEYRDTDSID